MTSRPPCAALQTRAGDLAMVQGEFTRAQELLEVELTDPDERLALHLACRSVLFHS